MEMAFQTNSEPGTYWSSVEKPGGMTAQIKRKLL
jgi:hypothetical protein